MVFTLEEEPEEKEQKLKKDYNQPKSKVDWSMQKVPILKGSKMMKIKKLNQE